MSQRGAVVVLLLLAAFLVLAFVASIAGYVAGSYLFMRAHVPKRRLLRTLREMVREAFWATLTQPLLPLFYLVGERAGGAAKGTPIVLVHGYSQNRVGFLRVARALRRAGLGPIFAINYPWHLPVEKNAARLARFVDRVLAETGAPAVDLVAHSMGGIISLVYASGPSARGKVRRLVTLASPHAGVAWRGPILGASGQDLRRGSALLSRLGHEQVPTRVLSIYSTHDNVVHPAATSALAARGGEDREVGEAGHLSILFDPRAIDEVVTFLAKESA
jgi:pimeloyl-ACP methyl ester carboxylesterase